jgi:phytoene dehydrogenase-like protein
MASPDAVVIGAGPNGLVAANLLADAGWSVVVLESQREPGGAVRSGQLTRPGFVHDLFSAFYPLAAASSVLAGLELESFGLRWRRAPLVLAHPRLDGRCAVLSTDLDTTAASLDADAPGDGDAWRRLYGLWQQVADPLLEAMFTTFPPVLHGARLAGRLGPAGMVRFARHVCLPVRRLAEENFRGEGGGLLLAGNALHTDLAPENAGSGVFGWLLASLGQQHGFPVPEGGAGNLTAALVRRLEARGGRVVCDAAVDRIEVRGGKAVAVRTADGREVEVRRAVLADVPAPALYLDLVGAEHLPAGLVDDISRFEYDHGTVKVDWALSGPIPWEAPAARRAGTVHVAESLDAMTRYAADLATGHLPGRPMLLMGQMKPADPTRSPAGTETAWAYTHVPRRVRGDAGGDLRGTWDRGEAEQFADRMTKGIERLAPGFGDLVLGRHIFTPPGLAAANPSLVGGAVNGGTAQFHQQLVFRPTPGLGRPSTPIANLYLASASAHPGGGVHGAPGANAAHVALASWRRRRVALAVGAAGALVAGMAARR